MSLQSGTTVALCGVDDRNSLLSFFSSKGIRVVSWASNSDALIVGAESDGRWKLSEARRLGLRCVPVADILAEARLSGALWVNVYAPRALGDLIGQGAVVAELQTWLRGWVAGKGGVPSGNGPKGALVSGPPGIGKTSAVHLVAAACGYDVLEFNASDERSASAVRRYFDEACQSGHCGRRRVVVMDEVDGMSSGDRGGLGELARIIARCVFPIICISNESKGNPRMRPLGACCADIRFTRPTKTMIAKALMTRIVRPRGLSYSVSDLETLCEHNGNDIRSIINALQFAGSFETGGKDELQRLDAFSAAGRLIGGSDSWAIKENLVYLDYGMVPLMVAEGYV
jgi:replication factor C subunit 1